MPPTSATNLEGRVAVVTGASRGIGKQVAIRLAGLGAQVVLAARTEDPRPATPGTLGETAAEVARVGPEPLTVAADLSRQDDLDRLVARVLDHFGGVDILVNNAGYTVGRAIYLHTPDLTREQWDKVMAINATAPLMLAQGFWPSMRERGGGRIVNVTSGAAGMQALGTSIAAPGMQSIGPAYGASKAALNRMANVLAVEGRPHDIAVINVEPGFVLTETMALTNETAGFTDSPAIGLDIPAAAVTHLCTCDPWPYTGTVVDGPAMVRELGLLA